MTKLLDPKRSQAIGIVIGRIDVREFRDALLNFDAAAFPLDTLKSIYDVVRTRTRNVHSTARIHPILSFNLKRS